MNLTDQEFTDKKVNQYLDSMITYRLSDMLQETIDTLRKSSLDVALKYFYAGKPFTKEELIKDMLNAPIQEGI